MNGEIESEAPEAEGEGQTLGEAKWAAVKTLQRRFPGVQPEDVEFEVVSDPGPEGEEALVKAFLDLEQWRERQWKLPAEPTERVRQVLERILIGIDVRATVSVVEEAESIAAEVNGAEVAILIGKRGRTIDAAQLLIAQIANKDAEQRKQIVLDAAGYRQRRRMVVERQAVKTADEAIRFGREVELAPMGSADRKTVHLYLGDRPDVETHSEGQGAERRVVVTPLESRID